MLPLMTEEVATDVNTKWNGVLNSYLRNVLNHVKDDPERKKLEQTPARNKRNRRKEKVNKDMEVFVADYKATMKDRLRAIGVPEEQLDEDNLPTDASLADRVLQNVMDYHSHCENLGKSYYTFERDDDDEEHQSQEDNDLQDEDDADDSLTRLTSAERLQQEELKAARSQRNEVKLERLRVLEGRRHRLPKMLESVQASECFRGSEIRNSFEDDLKP